MRIIRRFYHRICSLWYWLPVIWDDRDFDYRYTLFVLEHSLRRLHKFLSGPNIVAVRQESQLKRLWICILLLERLKGSYFDKARKIEPEHLFDDVYIDWNYKDCMYLEKQDWQYLWHLLEKYMQGWWD